MILTCPSCGTQYVVQDGAIPPGGRKVRCASCRHSWHQDPPTEETLELSEESELEAAPESAEEELADPVPEKDEPEAPDYWDRVGEPKEPPAELPASAPAEPEEDDFSPFARREQEQERRSGGWLKWLLALLLVALLAAAFWFLAPPAWKAQVGLAQAQQTPLQLMMTHSDRQQLASGNELLAVSGRVINPTDESHSVPPITAELRSSSGKLVYRWTIAPPARTLGPGASATFNSAEVNVPAGGEELTVSLGAPRA